MEITFIKCTFIKLEKSNDIRSAFTTNKFGASAKESNLFTYLASSVDLCLEKPVPYQRREGGREEKGGYEW